MTGLDLTEELRQLAQIRQARIAERHRVRAEHQQARRHGLVARHRRRLALVHLDQLQDQQETP